MLITDLKKDGAFDTYAHLPIALLLMDGLTCFEYTDPETKNRLTIKQALYYDNAAASQATAELCICTDSQRIWRDLMWIEMPEPMFHDLFNRWSSELKKDTAAQIRISATVSNNRKKAPAKVEYAWSDQPKTDRTL